MSAELRLLLDRLEAKCDPVRLPAVAARAIYVVDGSLALFNAGSRTTHATLGANSAVSAGLETWIGGGSQSALALRWELVNPDAEDAPVSVASRRLLVAPMTFNAGQEYLLRCDRVDFPPGGEALTHTHQGGGTRCLLLGSIRIETLGKSHAYEPMSAWFEAGPDPVYAAADASKPSAFARVMILPKALLGGQSSISYVKPEDLAKPKSQRYQLFIDEPIRRVP